MTKTRKNISVDDLTVSALDAQIAAGGEASAYIERLIDMAGRDRSIATAVIRDACITSSEMQAIYQALSSWGLGLSLATPKGTVRYLRVEAMSERQRASWLAAHGISTDRWTHICDAADADDDLAVALVLLARLYWCGDAIVLRAG